MGRSDINMPDEEWLSRYVTRTGIPSESPLGEYFANKAPQSDRNRVLNAWRQYQIRTRRAEALRNVSNQPKKMYTLLEVLEHVDESKKESNAIYGDLTSNLDGCIDVVRFAYQHVVKTGVKVTLKTIRHDLATIAEATGIPTPKLAGYSEALKYGMSMYSLHVDNDSMGWVLKAYWDIPAK